MADPVVTMSRDTVGAERAARAVSVSVAAPSTDTNDSGHGLLAGCDTAAAVRFAEVGAKRCAERPAGGAGPGLMAR